MVELGKRYRDRMTLFTGTAVARTEHMYGPWTATLLGTDSQNRPTAFEVEYPRIETLAGESIVEIDTESYEAFEVDVSGEIPGEAGSGRGGF